ncbi:MAG: hypothetical protein COX62_06400 [Deltaproteobacteria bacterium CG_4_10_14_0_2_um_filter_43_8]|nr:MAG: hypothetical protein COV43_03260 [Deltaproteobacteria bacterium CG11_big_fil_rev_8_21_14_0_20_42_23]PJA19587.1 MAG: hypothetical protein COX62_06400 [Deltaproteobacteria bacterium CG_4_10_14_0_2_um_filter_43_8]PJC63795.1 MAG: hypothetical protein CO021_07875 [Deltaproteobacteria bacterium CG_4_9_14_0_2_um_filter_42_21]
MKKKILKYLSLTFFSVLVIACAKDVITGKNTINYYKLSQEPALGKEVLTGQVKAFQKDNVAVDSPKNKAELETIKHIVRNISRVSHIPSFPYEVHVADAPVVNAWCAPGGKIMVYEGLWDKEKGLVEKGNKDELAAVLAHEISHATARHVTESISRNMTIYAAGSLAQSAIGVGSAEGADLFGRIFSEGFNVFVPSYSRKNESEADKLGLFYMAKAGYDPRAAVRLWERAAKKNKDQTSIYASHPASGERAAALKSYLPEAMKLYEKKIKEFGKPE